MLSDAGYHELIRTLLEGGAVDLEVLEADSARRGDPLGQALSILARSHGSVAWRQLCELFSGWRQTDGRWAEALEHIKSLLDPFPPDVRVLPTDWEDILASGRLFSPARMALTLDLSVNPRRASKLDQILQAKELASLRVLKLNRVPVGLPGVRALLRASHLTHLQSLHLRAADIGDRAAMVLMFVPHLSGLERLDVSINPHAGVALIEAMLKSPHPPRRLRALNLEATGVQGSTLRPFCKADPLEDLSSLNLSRCPLGDDGLHHLSSAPILEHLEVLELSEVEASAEAIVRLAERLPIGLRELDLSRNLMRPQDVQALAKTNSAQHLTSLNVSSCALFLQSHDDLYAAVHHTFEQAFASLRRLYLSSNHLGDQGVLALAHRAGSPLEVLDISENNVSAQGLKDWIRDFDSSHLRELYLNGNRRLGSSSVVGLCEGLKGERLEVLELASTQVDDDALIAMSRCTALRHLKHLGLNNNNITEHGAIALAESEVIEGLEFLSLMSNAISFQGAKALVSSPRLRRLQTLHIGGAVSSEAERKELHQAWNGEHAKLVLGSTKKGAR